MEDDNKIYREDDNIADREGENIANREEKNISGREDENKIGEVPPQIPGGVKPEVKPDEIDREWADKLGIPYEGTPVPPPIYAAVPQAPTPTQASAAEGNTDYHRRPMPQTFMLWSILATILCCMPAGVVAIIYSAQVSSKYFAQDYEGARRCSHKAEIWIIASIVTGVIFNALYLPFSMFLPI